VTYRIYFWKKPGERRLHMSHVPPDPSTLQALRQQGYRFYEGSMDLPDEPAVPIADEQVRIQVSAYPADHLVAGAPCVYCARPTHCIERESGRLACLRADCVSKRGCSTTEERQRAEAAEQAVRLYAEIAPPPPLPERELAISKADVAGRPPASEPDVQLSTSLMVRAAAVAGRQPAREAVAQITGDIVEVSEKIVVVAWHESWRGEGTFDRQGFLTLVRCGHFELSEKKEHV
jgi:hypothetical protein